MRWPLAMADEHRFRAAIPHDRVETLISVLCLSLLHASQQVCVAHPSVHGHHGFGDIVGERVADVVCMCGGGSSSLATAHW